MKVLFKEVGKRSVAMLVMLMASTMMLLAQEMNEKFSMTTQMFINELKAKAEQPAVTPHRAPGRDLSDNMRMKKPRRLIASPDTISGVAYISCFIHLKDVSNLSEVRSLGVEVEETFDGLDFITARVPVNQLDALAEVDNVTKIKVARQMRPMTDKAREVTNVDDLLTQSNDALALGVTDKYDGTGVVLGVIDTGIDFQHIAFKDKNGNSRIKRAYIQTGQYTSSGTEYTESNISSATTDDNSEDHGTHTATTAGGSSVIVNGTNVTVTDNHSSATYGGMAPGADLYLAGIKGLYDTGLTNALNKMVTYANNQNKPLVVSNSWGSGWGPRDGTGEFASLVAEHFGDTHPNRVILFAASNDAGHKNGNEGGGYFVKKSSASSSSPLGTIIRTDEYGGDYYVGLMACAWNASNSTKLNCKLHVLNSSGTIQKTWTITSSTTSFSGLSTYYSGSMAVYIEQENGKYRLALYSENGIESTSSGAYSLAIEVYPSSGSANINMWSGDWSFFTDNYTTSGHTWLDGTDDMCVSDEATIPDAISVGAYVSKKNWKASSGTSYTSNVYTVGDIAYFSSYATAEQSPTGVAYPWISAPGARLAAGVNHYHTTSVDSYSYYGSSYNTDLVVNNSSSPYAMMEGTSMATPVAAGIVALWLQASMDENAKSEYKNSLTVNKVKQIMEATAITDSYTNGTNASHFGKGKIDALAGIQYILGSTSSPLIKTTPTSIDFADKNPFATKTYTKTLNVKGFNLEGGITATLTDANGVYSLSQTSITQSAAADGVDITITYAPQSAGTHNATITLTSSNATDVVVNLTATAKPATPTIIADPETLTFTAGLNEQKSLTFDVLSEFLTGDISVALSDANSVFSIDKTSITKAESEEGATVKVTFNSATAGTFSGTVTLSSTGAENVVISLTGTAATTSDETIDFTEQGYTNQQEVTSVNGTNCTISFDKGSNTNAPKYYDTGSAIRIYGGSSMTVSSADKTIIGIELTFGSGDGTNAITTDVESYSDGTWTGSASSVTFTIGGTSGHRRIQKVKVTYAGGTTPTKQDVTMSFSPASATATMGEDFTEPILSTTPANLTVTYSSSNTGVATVDASTGEVTLVAAGTTTITASFAGNDSYNSGSANYTLTVNADPNAPGTENNPYTVAEARAAIDANTGITGVYATGTVSKIVTAYNSQYGNISYDISSDGLTTSDQLRVYRGKSYNGENFTSADDIQVGDVVVVYGNLTKYNNSIYEFTENNQLVSLVRQQDYYQPADGKKGSVLKTAMCGIIYDRTELGYDDLWTAYQTTDVRSDGYIWDMYSNITNYDPVNGSHANTEEGSGFNREHSFPKSWFGGEVMPMYTDLHHLYPVDGNINTRRSSNPYGETANPTWTSENNFSKTGPCTYPGTNYTGTVFEPADEYKGDFARTYFYMITCYEEKLHDWYTNYSSTEVTAVIDGSTYPGFQTWQLEMLMKWAKDDPVSEKETNRNNAVYAIQANRNPFIDYPGLQEYIWGTLTTAEFSYDNYLKPVYMSFSSNTSEATVGEAYTAPTLTTLPSNLTVTYSSSEPGVATVDNDGEVTLVAAGSTTITATFTGNDVNHSGSASYTLTVSEAQTQLSAPTDLALSNVTSSSITATWTAVDDATSYYLDVVQGSSFEASVGGKVLDSDFSDTSNWTLSGTGTYTGAGYYGEGSPSIKFDGTGDYAISPDFGSGAKLQFWAYGNGGSGSSFKISGLVNSSWTDIETVSIAQSGDTYEVNLPSGTSQVRFDFTKSVNCALDDVVVYGPGNSPESVDGYPKSVGNVTSYAITGLTSETQYAVRVRAVNGNGNSDWSSTATATTTVANCAPVLTVPQTSYAVTAGDPDVNFTVTVTGVPEPTVTATCTEGAYFLFENNEFSFETNDVGTYHFVFTATNSEGSDTKTVTIVVSPAPITVPTLAVTESGLTSTSAPVTWDVCDGVSSYTLQLASDDQFSIGGGSVELINEGFDDGTTLPDGWTVVSGSLGGTYTSSGNYGSSSPSLKFSSTVTLSSPTLSNPSDISFWYKGNGNSLTSTLVVEQLVSGSWEEVGSAAISSTASTFSHTLNSAATQVRFVFTKASGNVAFDDVVINGTSGPGSLISTQTVNGTSYTFTGLTSGTTYYARVKGDEDWSNVVSFTTNSTLMLENDADNSAAIDNASQTGKRYDVTLSNRTLYKDGAWNTLCVPFSMTAAQVSSQLAPTELKELDIEAGSYSHISGLDNNTLYLNFKDATSITAGKPYIIKWNKADGYDTADPDTRDLKSPTFSGVTMATSSTPTDVETTDGTVTFKGVYSPVELQKDDKTHLFLGSNNTLYWPAADVTVNAFRCYFELSDGTGNVKGFVLNFGDNDATGVQGVEGVQGVQDDSWYDLSGRKLGGKPTKKGIYIMGGKKFVFK